MSEKKFLSRCFTLFVGAMLLTACGSEERSTAVDATIISYQTEVAELEAENQDLSTVVAELTTLFGISEEVEPTPTVFDFSAATPDAVIGDGSRVQFQEWEIQFLAYDERLGSTDGETTYIISFEVVNTGSASIEFPYSDFFLSEPYGATYGHQTSTLEYSDYEDLVPGVSYERELYFTAPTAVENVFIRSNDGSVVIWLGGQ